MAQKLAPTLAKTELLSFAPFPEEINHTPWFMITPPIVHLKKMNC